MADNVLIIGNGFDIYHGFPTKYTDFLKFVSNLYDYYDNNKEKIDALGDDDRISIQLNQLIEINTKKINNPEGYLLEIDKGNKYILTTKVDNFWIRYFLSIEENIHENWIDFEKEIGNVLSVVKEFFDGKFANYIADATATPTNVFFNDFFSIFDFMDKEKLLEKEVEDLADFQMKSKLRRRYIDNKTIELLENRILAYIREELIELKKYLYFYMRSVVSKLETKVHSEQLEILQCVNLLNFNYTDFYSKIYNNQIIEDEHYIHGDLSDTNIVLGTDRGCKSKEEVGYLYFEKFFQRLQNQTGFKYREWIKRTASISDGPSNVIILGHSLDLIDMDLLKHFFDTNSNVEKITILYYCQEDFETKIINLIDAFGKETLENFMGIGRVVFEKWDPAVE